MTPLLEAHGLAISGRLQPTDLKLASGMTAVIGPNGAGKTSLLRALAGIELEIGQVPIAGEDSAQNSSGTADAAPLLPPCHAQPGLADFRERRHRLGLPSPDPARVDELLKQLELGGPRRPTGGPSVDR